MKKSIIYFVFFGIALSIPSLAFGGNINLIHD